MKEFLKQVQERYFPDETHVCTKIYFFTSADITYCEATCDDSAYVTRVGFEESYGYFPGCTECPATIVDTTGTSIGPPTKTFKSDPLPLSLSLSLFLSPSLSLSDIVISVCSVQHLEGEMSYVQRLFRLNCLCYEIFRPEFVDSETGKHCMASITFSKGWRSSKEGEFETCLPEESCVLINFPPDPSFKPTLPPPKPILITQEQKDYYRNGLFFCATKEFLKQVQERYFPDETHVCTNIHFFPKAADCEAACDDSAFMTRVGFEQSDGYLRSRKKNLAKKRKESKKQSRKRREQKGEKRGEIREGEQRESRDGEQREGEQREQRESRGRAEEEQREGEIDR